MSIYFLLLDGELFEARLRPALAASWRQRSFVPCRELCADLLARVEDFDRRYHIGAGESLIRQVAQNRGPKGPRFTAERTPRSPIFDRAIWRALAGELLFYAADEIPEFQTCPETLACLLAPEHLSGETTRCQDLPAIWQAHRGSRELTFGAATYRPDHCGLNNIEDVRRLSTYLSGIEPDSWRAEALARLPGLAEEDHEEELAVARDFFPALRQTYQRAAEAKQVIVIEIL